MPNQNSHQLLLNFLRQPDPQTPEEATPSLTPAEWQTLLDQAQGQGVASLLYSQLKHTQANPPAEILHTLQQASRLTATRNLLIFHELTRLLPAFEKHKIPVIALKGLHLSELVYQDPSLRPMSDMDLLLPYHQLGPGYNLLLEMGYQAPAFTNIEKETHRHHHLPPLTRQGGGVIELHWTLVAPGSPQHIDLDGVWQRAQPASLASASALVLCPEDLLLHLALHFCNHNFRLGLRHLYDLLASLQTYQAQIDWPSLQARSQAWRAQNCLFLALHLAHELLNAPLPADFLSELQPKGFSDSLAQQAQDRLFNPPPTSQLHPDLAQLWSAQTPRQKLGAAWRSLFPPLDYMRSRYHIAPNQPPPHPARIYPYYLLRLGQIIKEYGGQAWRLLRHNPQLTNAAQNENTLNNWLRRM